MQFNQILAAITAALLSLHGLADPATDQGPGKHAKAPNAISDSRVLSSARYRAIFCGQDGTETSAAYARALASDLKMLESRGRSTTDALAYLEQRACPGK